MHALKTFLASDNAKHHTNTQDNISQPMTTAAPTKPCTQAMPKRGWILTSYVTPNQANKHLFINCSHCPSGPLSTLLTTFTLQTSHTENLSDSLFLNCSPPCTYPLPVLADRHLPRAVTSASVQPASTAAVAEPLLAECVENKDGSNPACLMRLLHPECREL